VRMVVLCSRSLRLIYPFPPFQNLPPRDRHPPRLRRSTAFHPIPRHPPLHPSARPPEKHRHANVSPSSHRPSRSKLTPPSYLMCELRLDREKSAREVVSSFRFRRSFLLVASRTPTIVLEERLLQSWSRRAWSLLRSRLAGCPATAVAPASRDVSRGRIHPPRLLLVRAPALNDHTVRLGPPLHSLPGTRSFPCHCPPPPSPPAPMIIVKTTQQFCYPGRNLRMQKFRYQAYLILRRTTSTSPAFLKFTS
jgi:hypothetical protein